MGWSQPAPSTFFRYVTIFLKYEDFNSGRWNSIKNGWPTNQPTSKENPLDFAWTSSFNWGLRLKNNSQSSLYDPDMNGSELETKNKRNFFSFQKQYPLLQSVTNLRKVPVNAGLVFVVQTEAQTEAQRTKSIFQSILSSVSMVTGFSRLHRRPPLLLKTNGLDRHLAMIYITKILKCLSSLLYRNMLKKSFFVIWNKYLSFS